MLIYNDKIIITSSRSELQSLKNKAKQFSLKNNTHCMTLLKMHTVKGTCLLPLKYLFTPAALESSNKDCLKG